MTTQLKHKVIQVRLIKTPNDIYGNPTRFFQIYDRKGQYLGWIDDGYCGENFKLGRKVTWLSDRPMKIRESKRLKVGTQFENKGILKLLK